ncbi:MAG: hypothetical protein ACYC9Q_14805 [Bacillota bacterium]
MTVAEAAPYLSTDALGRHWHHVREADSTNALARELPEAGAPDGLVVVAETQRGGRGRLGRAWSSPRGGIWFSLLLRPRLLPSAAAMLTLVAAVAAGVEEVHCG